MDYAIVSTKEELEKALEAGVAQIIVTNSDLANHVRTVKAASQAGLTVAIAATGLAATNFWNPIGWTSGIIAATTSGTLIIAIIALGLGVTLIWALANGYSIKAKGKVKLPDGTEIEGELTLEKK